MMMTMNIYGATLSTGIESSKVRFYGGCRRLLGTTAASGAMKDESTRKTRGLKRNRTVCGWRDRGALGPKRVARGDAQFQ